jgi:hypothetical protein
MTWESDDAGTPPRVICPACRSRSASLTALPTLALGACLACGSTWKQNLDGSAFWTLRIRLIADGGERSRTVEIS